MLPIAVSVIQLLINDEDGFTKNDRNFSLSIMLGIAFSANIGGMSTLIGTPPNSVMLAFLNEAYQIDIGFFQWMQMGVPFAIVMLAITYFCITRLFYPNGLGRIGGSGDIIQKELEKLGKMSKGENIVLVIFLITAISWMFRSYLNSLFPTITLTDTTISVIAALLMFIVPINFKKGEFPLDWKDTSRLPWGILILFGGGLALASGLAQSGFIDMIGDYISGQTDWSMWVVTAVLIFLMLFMTELMSNVALVTILIPLVVGIAIGMDVPILQMVIPVTLASSCAFMLPMATPPNAIVFASGHVRVDQMARIGIVLNLISVGLLFALAYWVVPLLF
jgi:sodium-dependent dicarboxylate transporter 2/3/5